MAFPALAEAAAEVASVVVRLADEAPEAEDVKAGWTAFAIFLLLIAAVVVLGFSLTKRLRNAQAAEEAGVYGRDEPTEPVEPPATGEGSETAEPPGPDSDTRPAP